MQREDEIKCECRSACIITWFVVGAIILLGILTVYGILLNDYNIPEIRQACSNNLFNIMLLGIIFYPIAGVIIAGQSTWWGTNNGHEKWAVVALFAVISAVLRISFAYENIHNEICVNATSTKHSGQVGLAQEASLEKFAYFIASIECLLVVYFIRDSVNNLL
jgi:hypothetical protein